MAAPCMMSIRRFATVSLRWGNYLSGKENVSNSITRNLFPQQIIPSFQLQRSVSYRKVIEKKEGNVTTVEGIYVEDTSKVLRDENPHGACPLCRLNRMVSYKDVLILKQFVREDGQIYPSEITGVCQKQHIHLHKVVGQAFKAGLLPKPALSKESIPKLKTTYNTF
ncbi:large ribosomal subunit protein mL66-like [Glandiceps talaboti]